MIPKKAIKPIIKNSRDNTELAVGTLIAYGVFPQTQEGIQKAKDTIAANDKWLVPSELPNYYDGIDSDLLTGRETAGIIFIRNALKEFYEIDVEKKSAGTETAEDTRVNNSINVVVDEENNPDEKEVEAQAEAATEFITEAEDTAEKQIDESILDDLPASLQAALAKVISKKTGVKLPEAEKKASTSVTNTKIFKFLTNNLIKIQGQLASIDKSLQDQTKLVQANLQITANIYDSLDAQNSILSEKLGAILEAFNKQNELARKLAENEKDRIAEARLEAQRDVAGTETAVSTLGKGGTKSGNTLLRRLARFFGKRLASAIFRALPFALKRKVARLRQLKRLPKKLKESVARKLLQRVAPKIASRAAAKTTQAVAGRAIGTGVVKGFEHIALPGITKATQQGDKPAAKALEKSGDNILQRALKSPVIQKALLRVLGKEGAEKLTVKLAAKLIPGVSTAYGLGEGIARIAMGDVKGGFLSFGSAIPALGYGFAAIDILRDINIDAYNKHIDANLPTPPSNANIAAFFAEALGVTPDQYEMGGVTKPGTAMLHGTEGIFPAAAGNSTGSSDPANIVGGSLLAAVTQYVQNLGPSASSITGVIKQSAAPLAEEFDVPSTVIQTNVGGAFPSLGSTMKKIREGRKQTPEEELSGMEKDLLGEQDPDSFADKLLKMIDPEGKFQELLKRLNQRRTTDDDPMDLELIGDGAFDTGLRTGPSAVIGGSADYHQDLSFAPGVGIEEQRKLILQLAVAYDKVGRKMELSNEAVAGEIFPINGTNAEQIKWIEDARAAHRARNGGTGRDAIDFYAPSKNENRSGKSVENAPILAPVIEGGRASYFSGGASGAGIALSDKEGKEILKIIHGRTDIPLPKGGAIPSVSSRQLPTAQGLGRQGAAGNRDFGATSGVGSKGYLIVPGHAAGGGAPEEKKLVKQLAKNAYNNLKSKFPDAKIEYQDTDAMFEDTDLGPGYPPDKRYPGFNKQLEWFKQKEKEGWEILEVHMDASMESGQGTGRGVIVPTGELNPVEAYFAQNYGAFTRGHRDLGAPKRGVGLFEFGNMSPELQEASKQNKVSKQQLDALTAPFETAVGSALNMAPPAQRQSSNYKLRQGGDKKADTQFVIIPTSSTAGKTIAKNTTVEGQRFVYDASFGGYRTQNEVSSVERAKLIRRLGLN